MRKKSDPSHFKWVTHKLRGLFNTAYHPGIQTPLEKALTTHAPPKIGGEIGSCGEVSGGLGITSEQRSQFKVSAGISDLIIKPSLFNI